MTMKKIVLIAFLFALATGTAMAQQGQGGPGNAGGNGNPSVTGNPGGQGGPGNPVDRLTEVLGLDEIQAAALAAIFADAQLLRDQEQQRARDFACDVQASIHEQIVLLLDADQLALYEEHQAKRAEFRQMLDEMRQARGGAGGFGGHGAGGCDS
jgi:hypothetical protein